MNKKIMGLGFKLLGISIVARVIFFIYFSFSWQWENSLVRSVDLIMGILFLIIWLIYGVRIKIGFKSGLVVGLLGISDGILLLVVTYIAYITRGSYYPGPVTMVPWIVPFLGLFDQVTISYENVLIGLLPFIAVGATGLGSFLGVKYQKS